MEVGPRGKVAYDVSLLVSTVLATEGTLDQDQAGLQSRAEYAQKLFRKSSHSDSK